MPVYTTKTITEFALINSQSVIIPKLVNTWDSLVEFKSSCIEETPGSKAFSSTFKLKDWAIQMDEWVSLEYTQKNKSNCSMKSITDYVAPVIEEVNEETLQTEKSIDPKLEKFNIVRTRYLKEQWTKKSIDIAKVFVSSYVMNQGKLWENEDIAKEIYKIFSDFILNN